MQFKEATVFCLKDFFEWNSSKKRPAEWMKNFKKSLILAFEVNVHIFHFTFSIFSLHCTICPTFFCFMGLGVRRRRSFRFSLRAAFHSVVSFTSRFQQIFQSTRIRARHRVAAQLAIDGKIVQKIMT